VEGSILSFVVIGDLHLGRQGEGRWHNRLLYDQAEEIATMAVDMINDLSPKFVVVCGDITDLGVRENFERARAILERLRPPYILLTGNHDTMAPGSRRAMVETFPEQFPEGRIHRSFTHGDFTFITLDAHWLRSDGSLSEARDRGDGYHGMAIPPEQMEWLKDILARNDNKKCFLFTHFPLVPMAPYLRGEGRKDAGFMGKSDQVLDVTAKGPGVRACFAGHQHFHQIVKKDGIVHCINGAMIEYPMAFRQVELFSDRFEIRYIPFKDQSYPQKSLIDQDWVAGRPEDRDSVFLF
jgi:3',5'-cyclic AMP phosphodiesterase CpdA